MGSTNEIKEKINWVEVCRRISKIVEPTNNTNNPEADTAYKKWITAELGASWPEEQNLEKWKEQELILSLYIVINKFIKDKFRNSKEIERKNLQEIRNELQKSPKKLENDKEFGGWYHLLLGTVYYGQAMLKSEQYISAAVELSKANTHFERGAAELTAEIQDKYQKILYCLLLLGRAKYFIALVMDSKQKHNTRLLRALSLLNTVEAETKGEKNDSVIQKIYWTACITDIRIRRMLAVWNSPSKIRQLDKVHAYSFDQTGFMERCKGLMGELMKENISKELRRDICIQILLHVGLYYRETVLFPQSSLGKERLETAVRIFLTIVAIEENKELKEEEIKQHCEFEEKLLSAIWKGFGLKSTLSGILCSEDVEFIGNLCKYIKASPDENGKGISSWKNQDAKNNIAACLKKLEKYDEAQKMFVSLGKGNIYAKYQTMKFYFARHTIEEDELLEKLLASKNNKNADIGTKVSSDEAQEQRQHVLSDLSGYSRQWLFLYGRYLQRYKMHEDAQRIFRFLYQDAPIVWNSLEVKAVYLDADSYMLQEQFSEALELLDRLHDSISRVSAGDLEIRTEIDRGWCMLRLCRYEEALEVYSNLLTYICDTQKCDPALLCLGQMPSSMTEKIDSDTTVNSERNGSTDKSILDSVDVVPQASILNNIYSCLQQICSYEEKRDKLILNSTEGTKSGEPIWDSIDKLHQKRILNNIYLCLKYTRLDVAVKVSKLYEKLPSPPGKWRKLLDTVILGDSTVSTSMDITRWREYLRSNHTNNLAFRFFLLSMCKNIREKNSKETCEPILINYLLYTAEPIDLNTYTQIAKAFQFEKERDNTKSNRTLCSLFCHAKLTPTGVNQAFTKLMEDESFRQIDVVRRTQILASILFVYEAVVDIKKKCAVSYSDYKEIKHIYKYMKLSSLKHFLTLDAAVDTHPEEARLRISNICHMNDLLEGNAFIDYYSQADETKRKNLVNFTGDYECHGQNAVIPNFQSDVFVGCFTNRDDNFGMWNGYAEESTGCLVEIDPSYFDFTAVGSASPDIWGEDLGENTLYKVQYVRKTGGKYDLMDEKNNDMDELMKNLDERLRDLTLQIQIESCQQVSREVIHNFVADRINEIRYLFKTADYAYEEEYRILRCSQSAQINMNGRDGLPYIYIDVDRKLKIKSVQVGSNATLQQFMVISAWAKNCEGSPRVTWSDLNRRVSPQQEETIAGGANGN